MKFLTFKTLLVAAGLLIGSANAWAESTSLYERGTTNAWSDADLTDWTSAYCTPTISGGLSVATKNAGWTNTKAISVTANSIVTLDTTLKTGAAPGRNSSYDYIQIGGVKVGFNEQDQVAFVEVDGVTTNLFDKNSGYTRTTAYVIQVVINQATGAVSYTVGSVNGVSNSTTAITNVIFGHNRGGSEGYEINPVLQKIEVSEEKQEVSTADYTINYIFNESTIKTVANTTAIGATVNAENPITIDDVKYYAKTGEETSMTIVEGTNVLNVDLRTAETFSYTVKAVDGSSNVLNDNLASGSVTEGDAVTVTYPRWVLSGTTIYSCGTGTATYSTSFTPDADSYVKNITYNSGTVEDVVFYTEGEDVAGVSVGNNAARASKGQMGYTAGADTYVDVTTLAPGKYKIYMRSQNGNADARPYNFKVGENVVFTGSFANGTNTDANSDEFTVSESSTLSFASVGSSASGIDYFYVVKTGYATVQVEISDAGMATYVPAYDLDFSASEIKAYKAKVSSKGVCTLTEVANVPAGTPVLLIKDGGATEAIPVMTGAAAVTGNDLVAGTGAAVATNQTIDAVEYTNMILNNIDSKVGFYFANGQTVATNRAYLHIASTLAPDAVGGGARMRLVFEDDATGIEAIEAAETVGDGVVYNMAGQRVAAPTKGLYIVNGKKVLVK